MSDTLPVVYLARHGGTAWTISHQHTGVTDLPLTPQGEAEAGRLRQRLERLTFAAVLIFCQTILVLGVVALLEQHPLPELER